MGPFYVGQAPTIAFVIAGSPAKVHFVLRYPDETTDSFAMSAEGDSVYTVSLSAFTQDNDYGWRVNAYEGSGDSVPKDARSGTFKVHPNPFATPFEAP
jgi:hypothetical protein